MRVAVNSHALPIYKKNRIASLLCIFETIIVDSLFIVAPIVCMVSVCYAVLCLLSSFAIILVKRASWLFYFYCLPGVL